MVKNATDSLPKQNPEPLMEAASSSAARSAGCVGGVVGKFGRTAQPPALVAGTVVQGQPAALTSVSHGTMDHLKWQAHA
jgi:hypothetical protein